MKNYLKYTLIACLAFLYNCQDAIDIQQVGRLTPDITFETVNDLQQGLIGVYGRMDFFRDVALAANFTDEVSEGVSSGGQGRGGGHIFNVTPATGEGFAFWSNGYGQLNRANRLLEGIELVTPNDAAEQAQINDILGQTLVLRAFSHFQLLIHFTTDLADDNALAVPLIDFVPSITIQPLRNTNGEVYASIEADLDRAMPLLQNQSDATFISRDFVLAFRARMAAYRQNYTAAAMYANQLLPRYPLADRTQYQLMFSDLDNTELIFSLDRFLNGPFDGQPGSASVNTSGWIGGMFAFGGVGVAGAPYYEMNRAIFNMLNPADVRYDVNVHPTSIIAPDYTNTVNYRDEDVLVINKYPGIPGQELHNDQKVFRSSEMVLILAEAAAAQNNLPGAAMYVDMIRDARYGTDQAAPVYGSQQEAFAGIMSERRIEFAFEGHRWLDMKRLGQRAGVQVERDFIDCSEFPMTCTLPPTDFRFALPIPQIEFNGNPGLREQQNPGY